MMSALVSALWRLFPYLPIDIYLVHKLTCLLITVMNSLPFSLFSFYIFPIAAWCVRFNKTKTQCVTHWQQQQHSHLFQKFPYLSGQINF